MKNNNLLQWHDVFYKDNEMLFSGHNLLNFSKKIPGPYYIYSQKLLEKNLDSYLDAIKNHQVNTRVFFSVKSNINREIIKIIYAKGCGTDATSIGEIKESLASGVSTKEIIFSGVGKRKDELEFAIKNNILQINCESLNEMKLINDICKDLNKKINISVRINPEVDAYTLSKISTGKKGDKFGILIADLTSFYNEVKELENVKITGLAFHIGSQITNIDVFKVLFNKIREIYDLVRENFNIKTIDIGGGIGIAYKDGTSTIDISDYIKLLKDELLKYIPEETLIFLEPGRSIIGNTGILVAKVLYIKNSGGERFAVLDAAMNNLIRPAMYDSYHEILPLKVNHNEENYNFCGPVCESSDFFAKNRKASSLKEGDYVAILCAGAYGQAMASFYNARDICEEYLIGNNSSVRKIRNKISLEELSGLFYKN